MNLMVDNDHVDRPERRVKPRSSVSVPLSMYAHDRRRLLLRARTVDLSVAGALIHGSGPLRVGQTVEVEVARGKARNPLSLDAQVVRISTPTEHRKRHGIAVRFLGVNEIDEAIIESIIDAAKR